jgi:esterase/lipase superfamily enzyme
MCVAAILSACTFNRSIERNISESGYQITDAGKYLVVPITYATDRLQSARDSNVKYFLGERNSAPEKLSYGLLAIAVPKLHKIGVVEAPSWKRLEFRSNPDRHITVLDHSQWKKSDFLRNISKAGSRGTLIYVHGFNVPFEDAAIRAAQLTIDLQFKGASVLYSWPSQGNSTILSYVADGTSASWATPHFLELFEEIAQKTTGTLVIVAHSMGTKLVIDSIAQLPLSSKGLQKVRDNGLVILAAPDIDADVFCNNLRYNGNFKKLPITVYASSNDWALKFSKRVNNYPRAGDAGPGLVLSEGLETVDASKLDTSLIGHNYYAESGSLLFDIRKKIDRQVRTASEYKRTVRMANGRCDGTTEYITIGAES